MEIEDIEAAVKESRDHMGPVGEFEALQAIMTMLSFRYLIRPGLTRYRVIYVWYLERLVALQEELVRQINQSIPYRLSRYEPMRMTVLKIRAILDASPESARDQLPSQVEIAEGKG